MLSRKVNNRIFTKRKDDFFLRINCIFFAMRSCKYYFSLKIQCLLSEKSKKCITCIDSNKFCALIVLFVKLCRIHKKRIRLRNKVREIEMKLHHLKQQLLRAEDEEKEIMFREWEIINSLEEKEQQQKNILSDFLWNVFFEQFQMFDNLNWSFLVANSIDFFLDEIVEKVFCSSSDSWMILTYCLNVNILFTWWDTADSFLLKFFLLCISLLRLIQNETFSV